MTKVVLIVGVAALLCGGAATAQQPGRDAPTTRAQAESKVRERFAAVDGNRDGFVTRDEIAAAREKGRGERRDRRFGMLDTDHDGSISRAEFGAPPQDDRAGATGGHARHRRGMMAAGLLARADVDKDGRVALKEAVDGALAVFDRVDANHDGTITPDERRAARSAMRAKWRERHPS